MRWLALILALTGPVISTVGVALSSLSLIAGGVILALVGVELARTRS